MFLGSKTLDLHICLAAGTEQYVCKVKSCKVNSSCKNAQQLAVAIERVVLLVLPSTGLFSVKKVILPDGKRGDQILASGLVVISRWLVQAFCLIISLPLFWFHLLIFTHFSIPGKLTPSPLKVTLKIQFPDTC